MALGQRVKSVVLNIIAKDEDAIRKLDDIEERRKKLTDEPAEIKLGLTDEDVKLGLDDIKERLEAVKLKADEGIHLRVDDKEGEYALDLFKYKVERLSRYVSKPKIDLLGILKARAEIDLLELKLDEIEHKHHRIDLSIGGSSGKGLLWGGWGNFFGRGRNNLASGLERDAERELEKELEGGKGGKESIFRRLLGFAGAGGPGMGFLGTGLISALVAMGLSTGAGLLPLLAGGGAFGLGALLLDKYDSKGLAKALGKGGLFGGIDTMLKGVAKNILPSFVPIFKQFDEFAKTFGPFLDKLFKASAPVGGAILKGLEEFAKAVLPAITQSLKDLAPSLPLVTKAFLLMGQAIADLFKQLGPNGIKAGLQIFIVLLKGLVGIAAAVGWAFDHTSVTVVAAFTALVDVSKATWKAIKDAAVDAWHGIDDVIHAWVAIWKWSEAVLRDVWAGIASIIGLGKTMIATAFDWIKTRISAVWDSTWNFVKSVLDRGKSNIGNVFSEIRTNISHLWSAAWSLVKGILSGNISAVLRKLAGMQHSITSLFSRAGHWLIGAGSSLIHGLFAGAEQAVGDVGSWISSIGNTIIGAVKHFFGIASPSTVFAGIGKFMMDGLLHGMIANSLGLIEKVFGSWPSALARIVKRGLIAITDLPKALLHKLASLFGGIFSGFWHDLFGGHHSGHIQSSVASMSPGAGGGNFVVFHINVNVPPSANADAVAREIQKMLLNLKRHNGGAALGLT